MGGDRGSAYDRLGLGDYKQAEARRMEEDLVEATKQAEIKRITMQPDLEAQQMQMAQQQQLQQEQMQMEVENERQAQQTAFEGSEGFDVRGGGNPPMGAAPGMGREQVTGETFAGEGLA